MAAKKSAVFVAFILALHALPATAAFDPVQFVAQMHALGSVASVKNYGGNASAIMRGGIDGMELAISVSERNVHHPCPDCIFGARSCESQFGAATNGTELDSYCMTYLCCGMARDTCMIYSGFGDCFARATETHDLVNKIDGYLEAEDQDYCENVWAPQFVEDLKEAVAEAQAMASYDPDSPETTPDYSFVTNDNFWFGDED